MGGLAHTAGRLTSGAVALILAATLGSVGLSSCDAKMPGLQTGLFCGQTGPDDSGFHRTPHPVGSAGMAATVNGSATLRRAFSAASAANLMEFLAAISLAAVHVDGLPSRLLTLLP